MKKALLKKVRENFLLKVLSLVLAVFLWYFIAARGYSELTLQLPVELVNIPEGYEVIEKSIDRVNVSFLGSTKILRLLNPEQLRVSVDMKDAEQGSTELRLTPKDIKVPSAVSITDIEPGTIKITIDRVAEKVVPVALQFKHKNTPKHYTFTVSPDTVTIKGPETMLKKIRTIKTEPLELDPQEDAGSLKVELIPPSERIKLSTDKVEVTFSRIPKQ